MLSCRSAATFAYALLHCKGRLSDDTHGAVRYAAQHCAPNTIMADGREYPASECVKLRPAAAIRMDGRAWGC